MHIYKSTLFCKTVGTIFKVTFQLPTPVFFKETLENYYFAFINGKKCMFFAL